MTHTHACSVLLVIAAGCGGADEAMIDAPVAPVDAGSPGTGTATLVVTGTVAATPGVSNAGDPTNFTTDLVVDVKRAGAEVTTGTVTIASSNGSVALVFDATAMRWHGAQAGYARTYELDVASGSDTVAGVVIVGPDLHTFTQPTAGQTVDSTLPLPIAWARIDPAAAATVGTRMINGVSISDTGSYSLAAGLLRSKPDQVEMERLQLVRTQQVTPAGGAVGSVFRVSVSNAIDLLVRPTL